MYRDIDLLFDAAISETESLAIAEGLLSRSYRVWTVRDANSCLASVRRDNHHLLVLLRPARLSNETINLLLQAFSVDPYFGVAVPREVDTTTEGVIPLSSAYGDPELRSLHKTILEVLPPHYILPEIISACFLIRNFVLANFDLLDETYETLPGAFQHYLWRARRCGFRCAVTNRAIVRGRSTDPFVVSRIDTNRLHRENPDFGLAKGEFAEHPLHTHESLLGRALSCDQSLRQTLLIDARDVPTHINGTAEAFLGMCHGIAQSRSPWAITLLAPPPVATAHELSKRFPDWRFIDELNSRYFTAALRFSQPWNMTSMMDLHRTALFNFYMVLDTIAWDVLFVAPPGLAATWRFLSEYADGILYISKFTRDRFTERFPSAAHTPAYVCYLSFNLADYKIDKDAADPEEQDDFIFVIGNTLDHKDVAPTVDLLSSSFPDRKITAFGLKGHVKPFVNAVPSGDLPQAEVDSLFRRANVVVFPSFYEGFGFPILKALSYSCTVLVRQSELAFEVAGQYRGPGRLITFDSRAELVDKVGRIMAGLEVPQVPLGSALPDGEEPKDWKKIATGVLGFIEKRVEEIQKSRWPARQTAIEQLNEYAIERFVGL